MLFLFLGLILNFLQPNVDNAIQEQLDLYLQEIESRSNLTEYSWALTNLYRASCHKSNSIQRQVNRSSDSYPKKIISSINCGENLLDESFIEIINQNNLSGFAAYILLEAKETELFAPLYEALVERNEYSIPPEYLNLFESIRDNRLLLLSEIPIDSKDLIIHGIIYNYQKDIFLSEADQNLIIEEFQLSEPSISGLKRSIQTANVSFLLYDDDRYLEFSGLHHQILVDIYYPTIYLKVRFTRALAYSQHLIGRYDYHLELHRSIIEPLVSYFGLQDDIDDSKMSQGVSLYSLGKFSEARDIFEDLFYDPNANVNRARLYNNLSISYNRLGEKNKYIRYLLDALEEADDETEYDLQMIILSNLYYYYLGIGDHGTALAYLERARTIASNFNDEYQLAIINAITGNYYWKTENDTDKALEQFRLASTQFNPESNFDDYFRSNQIMSNIYIELDSLDKAKDILSIVSNTASQNSNGNAFIESTMGLLNISLIEQDLSMAEEYLEIINLYSLDDLDFNTLVKYNILVTDFQFQSGEQRLAYQNLRPVIDQVLDRARTTIDTQTGYWVQEDEYINAFNRLLSILISMGNEQEAVQLLDEIKTINDAALYNSPILRANRLTEEELARDQLLNSRIMSLRESFLYANDSDSRLEIKNQIDKLSAEREEILNKIREDGVIRKTPIWMIQQNLASDEQIIHFTEVGDFLYISYISNSEIHLRRITFESTEKALFTSVADQIALSKTNLFELYDIYDFLGIESDIDSDKSTIIVVPDNYLYRIPLEIFPSSTPEGPTSYGSTKYLIEKFNFEYFASLQEYHSDTRNSSVNFNADLSAFAISDFSNFEDSYLPTLPFATQEARTISNLLSRFKEKNIYMESEATKTAFLDDISNSKIVHIATHSEVSEQDPLFSTIYLNDQNNNSDIGALFAYELFNQQLNNELIMLNSCSSGSGDYLQGSGIMGITRALRYAGAKSMALNIWAVNDKVAYEFASVFYESLNDGSSKSESMREAKLALLQNGNANPHFWGAFMLTGDPSPITKRPDKAGLVFPILLVFIGSISFYLRKIYSI